jgi:enamine deaminase RidA (YjgF/YER057c/UK114 family)
MTLELINPEDLPTPRTYTHVIAATGGRLVFVAGQVADDAQNNLVGPGDLAAQARQAFANLGRCLAAAGGCAGPGTERPGGQPIRPPAMSVDVHPLGPLP